MPSLAPKNTWLNSELVTHALKNPWPIALTFIILAFVAAMVTFVIWSLGHRVDLVAPDYYEQEIRYQDQIDREERTNELSSEYGLFHDAATGSLIVRIPPEHAAAEGTIELYRPSDAALDREFPLSVHGDGRQEISLSSFAAGLWRARLRWTHQTNEYFVATAFMLE